MNQLDKKIVLEKLTPAQRRVVIAKDVIAALAAKKLTARAGTYCETDLNFKKVVGKSLREELPAAKKCNVCALGALFVAKVARFNDFNIGAYDDDYGYGFGIGNSDRIKETLSGYFEPTQLGLIETAFERDETFARKAFNNYNIGLGLTPAQRKQVRRAKNFSRSNDDAFCMRKIMQNIVANKGTFKP